MKRTFFSVVVAAGLVLSLPAVAQVDTTTIVTPDQTTVIADPADPAATAYAYPTTGWDPSLLMLASGGLAMGSVALKGFLRKRED